MDKVYPEVGTPLYLQQKPSGNYYCDIVKRPYTVVSVDSNEIIVQEADMIFDGPRYYDSFPVDIVPDPDGRLLTLHWAPSVGKWQENSIYPQYAYFGKYEYYPYLD